MTDQTLDDGKEADASDDDSILEEAKDRYQACEDADGGNRTDAVDDLRFLSGGLNQWDEKAAQQRLADNRPCLTVNNLPTYLHQVTNDQRQNKPSIKVHPVDDNADPETAEVIQGLIRHIEYDSNASVAYDTAVNSAAAIGFGYFRLVTEYVDERSDDQKLMFKRIRNALSVRIDPLSTEPDGSDMKFCFIETLMDRDEFERQYPDAGANDASLIGHEGNSGWLSETSVLVTEYYRIKKTPAALNLMSDGSKLLEGDEIPPGVRVVKKLRDSYRCKVEWFKITAADILDRTEIKCKWIPVFPVYGDEIDIEGKVIRSGIIRHSKDSFKMYNFWVTNATEEIGTRSKTPYIMAEGQDEGHEAEWASANTVPYSSLKYIPKTVDGVLVPPPQRQPMADVPVGMLAMMMHANDNKKATTGLFDSSLGAKGNATSGKQEMAQQRQGDVANFHYSDNLNTTMRQVGRCCVNMIPPYYDGDRIVRILGEDETSKPVPINKPTTEKVVNEQTGETESISKILNDLSVGTFDITVKAGPGYDTKRQEAAEFLTAAMQAAKDPATSAIMGYIAMKNQDMPGAEEAAKMLKKTLPPGIAEPDEEEEKNVVQTHKGPLPIEQVPKAIADMDQQIQMLTAQGPELQKQAEQVKAEAAQVATEKAALESQRAQLDAKTRELKLLEQLASKTLEAQDARDEADRTKIITDLKLMVGEAVQRLEGMKQQAVEAKAGEDGAVVEAKNQQAEAKNQEVTGIQQALTNKLTEAITLLAKVSAAPRRTVLENDASGMPVSAVSEPVM